MSPLTLFAVVVLLAGVARAWTWRRRARRQPPPGVLERARVWVTVAGRIAFGAAYLAIGIDDALASDAAPRVGTLGFCGGLGAAAAYFVLVRLGKTVADAPPRQFAFHVRTRLVRARVRGVRKLRRARDAFTGGTWEEFGPLRLDVLFGSSVQALVTLYVVVAALSMTLALMLVLDNLHSAATASRATATVASAKVIGAIIGFNSLSVLSVLTSCLLGTAGVVCALHLAGAVRVRADWRGSLRDIAAATGYGTVAGFIAAALMPLPVVWGMARGMTDIGLTPQVLVDLPAMGAVAGYAAGVAWSSTRLFAGASNLLARFVPSLAMSGTVLVVLGGLGLTPRRIMSALLDAWPNPTIPCDASLEAITELVQTPGTLVRLAERCGMSELYIADDASLWCGVIAPFACGIVRMVWDVRHRCRELRDRRRAS